MKQLARVSPGTGVTDPLTVVMVAPPWYTVPPRGYGGIEALVADTAAQLAERGHEVTVISAGPVDGTMPAVHRVVTYREPPTAELGLELPAVAHAAEALAVVRELRPDVVHDHTTAFSLGAAALPCPVVLTAHGPPEGHLGRYLAAVGEQTALVAISEGQRTQAPDLPWYATVPNGLVVEPIPFSAQPGDGVAFLGRMSPDKGAHVAIDVARAAGRLIRLAGKCSEPEERKYFAEEIEPRLGEGVEWLGELDAEAKYQLLGEAACLLFPLQWPEPFGLVMIESMACGTPVLSLAGGAVSEVVRDGVTGFVRDHPDELVDCLGRLDEISRPACRERRRELLDRADGQRVRGRLSLSARKGRLRPMVAALVPGKWLAEAKPDSLALALR